MIISYVYRASIHQFMIFSYRARCSCLYLAMLSSDERPLSTIQTCKLKLVLYRYPYVERARYR